MKALLLRAALGFTPGGGLINAALTALKAIWTFLCWLGADIADAFKEPWRFVVRTVCGVAILLLGVHLGMDHMREQRDTWRDAHAQLIEDARKADADNKAKDAAALKAREDAAAAERAALAAKAKRVKTVPVGPPAAEPKRVQPKRAAAGKDAGGGSGLQWWVPTLPWGQDKAK